MSEKPDNERVAPTDPALIDDCVDAWACGPRNLHAICGTCGGRWGVHVAWRCPAGTVWTPAVTTTGEES